MTEKEIIDKWNQGLGKITLAKMYKRQYNLNIRIMRADIKNGHKGKYINEYEALSIVENKIYKYIRKKINIIYFIKLK